MQERPVETTLYSLKSAPPERCDRRDDDRHLTLFRVGSITIGERRELCLIKNISAGGMLMRAFSAVEPGSRVAVELKSGEPVSGSVRWVEGNSVGVSFDDPVDVVDLLTASASGPRPRMPRVELSCAATVRQDADVHRVHARDISQGGVKIEARQSLHIGADVVVSLTGLPPQPGVVRWQDGGCYGITFNRVLPLSVLVGWLQDQRRQGLRAAG